MIQSLLQRIAAHEWHHQIRKGTFVRYAVNGDHIGVDDRCGRFGFPSKPLASRPAAGEMGSHHFDGHNAIERPLMSFQHHAHPARANHPRDFIAANATERLWVVGGAERLEYLFDL
ncbi:hypothetical protein Poly51_61900 [Rubripirellula tenax]|uniref:Uncharacterized protein n=1 Tax=Rubripirellula tenax TaxID=2528015 RepID=A0A5C6E7D6_9BACT|nr:hypothetical protein Poly51_61900 [Rubripirellula tenax]